MEIVTLERAEVYFRENGISNPFEARCDDDLTELRFHFEHEDHTRSLYPIAHFIASVVCNSGPTLGAVDKMHIWESGTDPHLVSLVLADCFGTSAPQFANRCKFIWTPEERRSATSLIHLALLFGWDLHLFSNYRDQEVFISHDGFFQVFLMCDHANLEKRFMDEAGRVFEIIK